NRVSGDRRAQPLGAPLGPRLRPSLGQRGLRGRRARLSRRAVSEHFRLGRRFLAHPASVDAMGENREPDDREKALSAEERKTAALRRRREIYDALMKALRGG